MKNIVSEIENAKNMEELDSLRLEIIHAIQNGADFQALQDTFRKQKNRIRRHGGRL